MMELLGAAPPMRRTQWRGLGGPEIWGLSLNLRSAELSFAKALLGFGADGRR
jgi:hypothetical protein